MINDNLAISIIKKVMACKQCKKNAKKGLKLLKDVLTGKNKNLKKPKTECTKRREGEQNWIDNSNEGKRLSALAKPNRAETIILVVGAWIPLVVGYVTIIRFIISLF